MSVAFSPVQSVPSSIHKERNISHFHKPYMCWLQVSHFHKPCAGLCRLHILCAVSNFFLKSLSCFIYLLQGKILRSKYLDREIFFSPFLFFCCFRSDPIFSVVSFTMLFLVIFFCSNVWIELMQEWFHRVHAFLFFVKFAYQYFLLHFQIKNNFIFKFILRHSTQNS